MEKVYSVNGFRATEHFQTAEYFKKFSEICNSFNSLSDIDLNEVGVDEAQLEYMCDVEKLRLPCEPIHLPAEIPDKLLTKTKLDDYYIINDEARHLNVIRTKEALDIIRKTPEYRFGGKRFIKAVVTEAVDIDERQDITPGSEFIYSILIYKPCSIYHGQRNSAEKLRFAFEIEALGSNMLSEVVDIIHCVSNSRIIKEVENTSVDLLQFKDARKSYPSQFVFIDGVFYNDDRVPHAIDLSPIIIQWAKEKNIGKFTTKKMQDVILSSLTPRLGFPYVYLHQGDCEHMFVFSDARLIQSRNCLSGDKYPKIVSFSRAFNTMCCICTSRVSQWMVAKCDRFFQEKAFLCTECCNSYLYVNGQKVTTFNLYPLFEQKMF